MSARCRVVDQELVGVGPAVVADGDGLAAPDQLGPAQAEVAASAAGSGRWAGRRSVPSQPSIGRIAKRLPIVAGRRR